MGALVDSFGRVHTDLRVSLTDKCNLRCTYCMPAEGLDWLPSPDLLTDDEVVRLVSLAVRDLGISAVRLTGGEPLLRRGLVDIVGQLAALEPRPKLALTTNGIGLAKVASDLAAAGLDRVNVSLDTLRAERFRELSRRDRLDDVLAGLDAARDAGLAPVKVNAVLMRGLNDDEALDLLHFCLERGFQMRFIEQMPLDAQHGWTRTEMVTAEEIHAALGAEHTLEPVAGRGSAPAEEFLVDGGPATVGVIASVTKPFCGACDRVRLTADGQLRNCLFAREESDLRAPLRAGASDAELAIRWHAAIAAKRAGHGIDDPTFLQPDRPMSAIGGGPRRRTTPSSWRAAGPAGCTCRTRRASSWPAYRCSTASLLQSRRRARSSSSANRARPSSTSAGCAKSRREAGLPLRWPPPSTMSTTTSSSSSPVTCRSYNPATSIACCRQLPTTAPCTSTRRAASSGCAARGGRLPCECPHRARRGSAPARRCAGHSAGCGSPGWRHPVGTTTATLRTTRSERRRCSGERARRVRPYHLPRTRPRRRSGRPEPHP